jgi:hypothetical protein
VLGNPPRDPILTIPLLPEGLEGMRPEH